MPKIVLLCFVMLITGCTSQQTATSKPTLGFDGSDLSTTVRAQDDFWMYVNGNWIEQTQIPADRSSYGTFWQLIDRTEAQIRVILDELAAQESDLHADQTIQNLYVSFLNQDKLDELGLAPLQAELRRIDGLKNHAELTQLFGEYAALGINGPIQFYADNNAQDATQLILYLWQNGLGLPNRDYYLSDQEKLVEARQAYVAHIEEMFNLAGWDNAKQAAQNVFEVEEQFAALHWTQVQNRNRQEIYSNQYSATSAQDHTQNFDLSIWFKGFGLSVPDTLVMAQTSYFAAVGNLVQNTDLNTWQQYLKFHLLKSFAPYLSRDIDNANFEFVGRKLRGQESQSPRWKRGVRFINNSTGELLGKIYVRKHFPESYKQEIGALVENLREAFRVSINELEWMSDATKAQAILKLDAFLPKLGYPDTWRDFSTLTTGDNLVNNVINVRKFNHAYELQTLNEPVDRQKWSTNPQTVNAFYRPTHNSITFPAGILQKPMFDAQADPAMNYGAIGSIIGHEFSHGFDDQGRKFDGQGLLRNWWTDEDAEQYQARAKKLVSQFNNFKPLPDASINGELTLGENIGDLAGVIMAYRAFELSGHADGPNIAGLTPRQRFFIGYAVAFRNKVRAPYLRELLLRDSHSPGQYRVQGALPNVEGFYEAFNIQPNDGMYLDPQLRTKIW